MKTNEKPLFTKELEREYDRFVTERRKRDLKRKPVPPVKRRPSGPDRSGY